MGRTSSMRTGAHDVVHNADTGSLGASLKDSAVLVQRQRADSRLGRFSPSQITPPDATPPPLGTPESITMPECGPLSMSYKQKLYWDLHCRESSVHLNIGIAWVLAQKCSLIPLQTALKVRRCGPHEIRDI